MRLGNCHSPAALARGASKQERKLNETRTQAPARRRLPGRPGPVGRRADPAAAPAPVPARPRRHDDEPGHPGMMQEQHARTCSSAGRSAKPPSSRSCRSRRPRKAPGTRGRLAQPLPTAASRARRLAQLTTPERIDRMRALRAARARRDGPARRRHQDLLCGADARQQKAFDALTAHRRGMAGHGWGVTTAGTAVHIGQTLHERLAAHRLLRRAALEHRRLPSGTPARIAVASGVR